MTLVLSICSAFVTLFDPISPKHQSTLFSLVSKLIGGTVGSEQWINQTFDIISLSSKTYFFSLTQEHSIASTWGPKPMEQTCSRSSQRCTKCYRRCHTYCTVETGIWKIFECHWKPSTIRRIATMWFIGHNLSYIEPFAKDSSATSSFFFPFFLILLIEVFFFLWNRKYICSILFPCFFCFCVTCITGFLFWAFHFNFY